MLGAGCQRPAAPPTASKNCTATWSGSSSCSAAAAASTCSASRRHHLARLPGQPRIRRALPASLAPIREASMTLAYSTWATGVAVTSWREPGRRWWAVVFASGITEPLIHITDRLTQVTQIVVGSQQALLHKTLRAYLWSMRQGRRPESHSRGSPESRSTPSASQCCTRFGTGTAGSVATSPSATDPAGPATPHTFPAYVPSAKCTPMCMACSSVWLSRANPHADGTGR